MKYKTLKALKKAYDTGALTKKDVLWLDNDYTFAYRGDVKVFEGGGPKDLLREALTLLGIPHSGV